MNSHSSKESTNAQQQRIEQERLAALADLRETFSSEAGLRTLERLKQKVGYPRPAYVPGDPYGTHFNDGRKSVIAELLHDLALPEDGTGTVPKALV
jgi:hypothetical protein